MGPSQFTENSRNNVMLEAHIPGDGLPDVEETVEQKRLLIDNFLLAVSFRIFYETSLRNLVQRHLRSVYEI